MKKPIIPCNFCGLNCDLEGDCTYYGGLIECSVDGGYDSTPGNGNGALDDLNRYTFSLCEFCLDWLFCQFKISPEVESYHGLYGWQKGETFRSAEERVKNDNWRRFKDEFFTEFEKRNKARNERLN